MVRLPFGNRVTNYIVYEQNLKKKSEKYGLALKIVWQKILVLVEGKLRKIGGPGI